jgi:flagellar biosynthesis protein FliP
VIGALGAAASEPGLTLALGGGAGGSSAVKIFLLLTALSFASAVFVSLTSFTRIVIVLSFLRQALGTPSLPPNQVLVGLSLALTCFVMADPAQRAYREGLAPYLEDRLGHAEALQKGAGPLREFMLRQTREKDLKLFFEISRTPAPARADQIPMSVAVPAFMISELTTAFRMGLYVYLPLLLVDLLVSGILMSLGMMMVPPSLVSLPLKLGIFLMADGWHLVVASLARSF